MTNFTIETNRVTRDIVRTITTTTTARVLDRVETAAGLRRASAQRGSMMGLAFALDLTDDLKDLGYALVKLETTTSEHDQDKVEPLAAWERELLGG